MPVTKRDRFYKRLFEIIPGFLTWATMISLFVLAFVRPLWVAIFVITFDLYWVIRMMYLSMLMLFAYRRLARERVLDWFEKCKALGKTNGMEYRDIYHAILFPAHKEGIDILKPSIEALENSNYPKKSMIVILSVEERAGEESKNNALILKREHENNFKAFIVTVHPKDLPGEIKAKGANATWGAKALKDFLDFEGIDYEQVIISCFDADTCADREYFGCLTYHYITSPHRTRSSYQPIPVYNNNIWHCRSIARLLELGSSFMQMIETMRIEKFVTFSSHSMSFKTLVEVGYWPLDMISDDSVIYWKCFLHFNGDYSVVPMYVTVSMDVATEERILPTIVKQYKQKRRWAWGIENFPYIAVGFMHNRRIPIITKIRRSLNVLESHYTWAVWAVIVTFVAPLTLIFGGGLFRQTSIGYNLPSVSATLLDMSLLTMLICVFVSMKLLPPRPPDVKRQKHFIMYAQWVIAPLVATILGSTPAIDAQTRLMFGKYMHFQVTEKKRHHKNKT